MNSAHVTLNFVWQVAGLLATGGKPSRTEQVDWLISQGFKAIVSLDPIPDQCERLICRQAVWLEIDLNQYGSDEEFNIDKLPPSVWKSFEAFLAHNLENDWSVYVHCSAGIARSPRMVRRYLSLTGNVTTSAKS